MDDEQGGTVAQETTEDLRANMDWLFGEDGIDSLLFNADLDAIGGLSRTSQTLRNRVGIHVGHRIAETFQPFVDDVEDFQATLTETNSVVSGSAALHAVFPKAWEPCDMDVYTPLGQADAMIEHLVQVENYHVVNDYTVPGPGDAQDEADDPPNENVPGPQEHADGNNHPPLYTQQYTTNHHIHRVIRIERAPPATHLGPSRFIDVVESTETSAIAPIADFISTFVMNWITGDKEIWVMYPKLTLRGLGVMNGKRDGRQSEKQDAWRKKYEDRGYLAYDSTAALDEPCGEACPARVRRAGDVGCLVAGRTRIDLEEEEAADEEHGGEGASTWTVQGWMKADEGRVECKNTLCENFGAEMGSAGQY